MAFEQINLSITPVDGGSTPVTDGVEDGNRPPRLPRWTRQEILVLIQGKRVAENRVRRGRTASMGLGSCHIEPKWASVSSYCKRHSVNRGPVQCRKRWSNLAGDFKRIKEWENQVTDETESFWVMRNDLRRERRLPGFFDKEVYDILDGTTIGAPSGLALALAPFQMPEPNAEEEREVESKAIIFDSGRSAGSEEGLFSDFEQDDDDIGVAPGKPTLLKDVQPINTAAVEDSGMSISENQYQPGLRGDQNRENEQQPASNPEMGYTSSQGERKRKKTTTDAEDKDKDKDETTNLQNQLIEVMERNGRILNAQLEAHNISFQLDLEQRKVHSDGLVAVLNKLADALGRIADKL